jgi:hypothetical protein
LIGSGRGRDYVNDGFSHWAEEDREILKILSNIESRWPESDQELPAMIDEMIARPVPYYINLKK